MGMAQNLSKYRSGLPGAVAQNIIKMPLFSSHHITLFGKKTGFLILILNKTFGFY